jgi:hypothetical protein
MVWLRRLDLYLKLKLYISLFSSYESIPILARVKQCYRSLLNGFVILLFLLTIFSPIDICGDKYPNR